MTSHDTRKPGWVLVTGGSRGIGRGLVQAFANEGRQVVFTYQSAVDAAESLARDLTKAGALVAGLRCDCSDEDAVSAMAARMLAEHGTPEVVVNNVGITQDAAILSMSSTQWHAVMDVNLHSAFYVTQRFVQPMVEQGRGLILQMSSVSGVKGNPGQTNYSATKAALIGMTRSMALELARFNVRVNAVLPGFIATEMVQQMPESRQAAIKRGIPLRRMGTVQEVAALCRFLASEEASYITGQAFVIDGGLTA